MVLCLPYKANQFLLRSWGFEFVQFLLKFLDRVFEFFFDGLEVLLAFVLCLCVCVFKVPSAFARGPRL